MFQVLFVTACVLIASTNAIGISDRPSKLQVNIPKVASPAAVKFPPIDFAFLSVIFINQAQICGGTLVSASWILTSATCLKDPAEGLASLVSIALGGSNKPTQVAAKVVVHTGYDAATYANNVGMVKLTTAAVVDGKKIGLATLGSDTTADVYVGATLAFCGWGVTDNKRTPAKKLSCTTLSGIAATTCSANSAIVCTKWTDRDNNVCPGDYGGALYVNSSSSLTAVGIAGYSPNINSASPCLGGHNVEFSQIAGFAEFITAALSL